MLERDLFLFKLAKIFGDGCTHLVNLIWSQLLELLKGRGQDDTLETLRKALTKLSHVGAMEYGARLLHDVTQVVDVGDVEI